MNMQQSQLPLPFVLRVPVAQSRNGYPYFCELRGLQPSSTVVAELEGELFSRTSAVPHRGLWPGPGAAHVLLLTALTPKVAAGRSLDS